MHPAAASSPPEVIEPGTPPPAALRPGPSLALVCGAFVAGVLLAAVMATVAFAIVRDIDSPIVVAASFVGLWTPQVAAPLLASRVFGSGSVGADLGLRFTASDFAWAPAIAIAALLATSASQWALSPFPDLLGTNTGFIEELSSTTAGVVVIIVTTMIGAPIVEELFFRGLLQRSMARLGLAAVLLQAIIFGLVHGLADPTQGKGNVGIALGVGTMGLVQGFAARSLGRIGPTILSHAMFNAMAVIPLLLG